MFVQALGQLSAFASAILLARFFAVNEYGQYMFGVTAATICAVIATLGADGILARNWGWSDKKGQKRAVEVFTYHNWFWRKGISLLLLAILALVGYLYFINPYVSFIEVFSFLFALPFFMANLLQSFYIANRKVVYANLIQLFMRLCMLIIIAVFFFLKLNYPISLVGLIFIVIFSYMLLLWFKVSCHYGFDAKKPHGSNLAFMLLKWGNLLLSQIDIVLLKIFSTDENIAYYAVALQLSALVVFVLNAVSANIMAQVANDYKHLSHEDFQHKITGYTRIVFSLSMLGMLALVIGGYWITQLYGEAYTQAYYLFCILMIGQSINILCGSVFTILNMAGFEKITCRVFYIALSINIVLGIWFIFYWHAYGVAIASSIAMAFWNIYLLVIVVKRLRINPTVFVRKRSIKT